VYLTPPDVRPISTAKLTELWRERVGALAGLEFLKFESDAGGPGRGAAIAVELSHRRINVLEQASAELGNELGFFPNVKDIDDGFAPGKQQIDFQIKPEGRSLGLRSQEVARQVRYAYYGAEVLKSIFRSNPKDAVWDYAPRKWPGRCVMPITVPKCCVSSVGATRLR
jgi:multidrug efflux pump subunit AcrB